MLEAHEWDDVLGRLVGVQFRGTKRFASATILDALGVAQDKESKTESRKAGAVTTLHDAQESNLPNQAARVRTFSNSPIFSEAFSPDPVNTSTVASPRRKTPQAMSCDNPAAAAADVGST